MAELPIRSLTLWKQGIGYFVRRGLVEERMVSLVVSRTATNDLLKSLNIVVHAGGQVLSVDYETPEDKNNVLSDLSVKLADRSSLVDLLVSLRGSHVILMLTNEETATGRLIGVEASLDNTVQPPTVILQGSNKEQNELYVFPITRLQGVRLLDERATTDVSFFLDVSRMEHSRTTLTVRVSEGQHDLEIGYLAPSPIWRVSYRLVNRGNGQAQLTAWGIFENSLDEDLDDVSLTLISGRPISFMYDLYESRVPPRPQVSDDISSLEQASADPRIVEAMGSIAHDLRAPLSSISGYLQMARMDGSLTPKQDNFIQRALESVERMNSMFGDLLSMVRMRDDDGNRVDSQAIANYYRSGSLGDLKVSGRYFTPVMMSNAEAEFMTYHVENAVSVKRGQSAMVPIIQAAVAYTELIVYNGDKMPNHPLKVWDLQNTTGFALEQGPITLIDNNYLGEGLMRFSGVGDNIQIPYALEFGILIAEEVKIYKQQFYAVEFNATQLEVTISRSQLSEYRYHLTSRVEQDMTVFIERRDPTKGEYFGMAQPTFSAAGHSRWAVAVPAKTEAEFTVHIRQISEQSANIANWKPEFIEELNAVGMLSAQRYQLLLDLLAQKEVVQAATGLIVNQQKEQERIQTRQEQLRKNLTALGTSERETTIRNQLLDDLENSENRRRELDNEIETQQELIKAAEQRQAEIINQLYTESE
jgi:signal transduction histidine kinase